MVGISDRTAGKTLQNTSKLFNDIAKKYPLDNYTQLCNELVGMSYSQSQAILTKHHLDYKAATCQVLNMWECEGNATRAKLESALKETETGGLCSIVAEHFNKMDEDSEKKEEDDNEDGSSEGEEEENDEDEELEEEDEDYADGESAGVSQRGGKGSQIINASGSAKVKDNEMIGSVTNVIHNYYRAGAKSRKGKRKTDKSSGRKRKAVESSGGKRKTKRKK